MATSGLLFYPGALISCTGGLSLAPLKSLTRGALATPSPAPHTDSR